MKKERDQNLECFYSVKLLGSVLSYCNLALIIFAIYGLVDHFGIHNWRATTASCS